MPVFYTETPPTADLTASNFQDGDVTDLVDPSVIAYVTQEVLKPNIVPPEILFPTDNTPLYGAPTPHPLPITVNLSPYETSSIFRGQHTETEYVISTPTDPNYLSPVFSLVSNTDLESTDIPSGTLTPGTNYNLRVRMLSGYYTSGWVEVTFYV